MYPVNEIKNGNESMSRSGFQQFIMRLEPIVIDAPRMRRVLQKMDKSQWPCSLIELRRLGAPHYLTKGLLTFASDTITEAELVRAFVVFFTQERRTHTGKPFEFLSAVLRGQARELRPSLNAEEQLVLMSLNAVLPNGLSHWSEILPVTLLAQAEGCH